MIAICYNSVQHNFFCLFVYTEIILGGWGRGLKGGWGGVKVGLFLVVLQPGHQLSLVQRQGPQQRCCRIQVHLIGAEPPQAGAG